ncbi:FHA modulated ABC efflux pump with fused ATPase and integral membrane subunits [Chthoniobacter flavus Ellin428]|uniref:FHA modulated ABC efflux pump with fused ATPase and integral membrane subunits n=1 Tax=Chthoniobacter flavus Ellin428 TaxID=497964 RepID=B4D5D3_9BACT|nr:FHA domain-containing protein [Chthoniobacter flavus]EDY18338.1 FHA modulated ABC efflux pump with fused ATPase and integral membrane subunits [Chthoniobacter flavus Ellin428]TCO91361.1 FHA modulated ABC efflux pump with fused ATPase and integral membrane subunit [Chthoniobacter flavus]
MNGAHLAVTSGLPARVFALRAGSFVAGRAAEVDFELSHVEISRQHCRFTWDGNKCIVEDLGSVRGTRVNGHRIETPTTLNPGDQVGVGPAVIVFGLGEVPAPASKKEPPSGPAGNAQMLVFGKPADRIQVDRPMTFGRDPGTDIMLNDPGVSRRHASVAPGERGGVIVTDLNSTAGSFVNGHRFDTHELTIGDRLQIGPFCFHFDGHSLNRVANAAGGTIRSDHVFMRSGTLTILDDVVLTIPASRFVGIIGPSGAGKSSLLTTLSGLRAPEKGLVLVDGKDIYSGNEPQSFGFVPQEDIVHADLTVDQALRFSARLRLPAGTPPREIDKLLLQTMDQLGLRAHARKPINRLSGGQRKRVSVGVELLAKPAILFLDEPSSGLDPATEFQLMELLRDLADTGCTIVCTTHVMENAYLMDQLIVLCGGCLAFQGSSQAAREYFGVQKLTGLYDRLADRPAKEWQKAFVDRPASADEMPPPIGPSVRIAKPARRAFALPILLARQWTILSSDWRNFVLLISQPIIIAALVSWVSDDRALIMFFAYLATMWFGTSNAAQEIVKEIAIYRRERLVGVGAHSYLASKFIFLITLTAFQALLLYVTVMIGEGKRDGSVMLQLASLLGIAIAGVGIGAAISALSRSVMQAVMFVPLILIPQILFSGYTVASTDMSHKVLLVSRLTPTFCAQTVMDTSFLWQRELSGELISDHHQSYRNLDPNREFSTGDVYNKFHPAKRGLIGLLCWGIFTYFVAWFTLKKRERV